MDKRPDRTFIRQEWVQQAVAHPSRQVAQRDGRTDSTTGRNRRDGGQYLRLVLLRDGQSVHNPFFDRAEARLKRDAGLGVSAFATEWRFLNAAKGARNAIAHNASKIRREKMLARTVSGACAQRAAIT